MLGRLINCGKRLADVPTGFTPALFAQSLAFWAIALLWPVPSWATAADDYSTLGGIICNLHGRASGIVPYALSVVSYLMGAFLSVRGILLLKKHHENPNEGNTVKGIATLVAGGGLLSLPGFVEVMQGTIFSSTNSLGGNGLAGCEPISASVVTGASADMSTMITNFVQNLYQPMILMVAGLGVVIGIFYIVKGLVKSSKIGSDPKAAAPHSIVAHFVIGAILISLSEMLYHTLGTILGTNTIDPTSSFANLVDWNSVDSSIDTAAADKVITSVLAFVQVIGFISFLRGWVIIKNAVEGGGQDTVPKGLTHIIGGAMAINIGTMVQYMSNTFGMCIISGNSCGGS